MTMGTRTEVKRPTTTQMKIKTNTLRTANHRWGLLLWPLLALLASVLDLGLAWKCKYIEFPADEERMGGPWWIYGTWPGSVNQCMVKQLNMYWNRITYTDYTNFAVELHCSEPWFMPSMAIYIRVQYPQTEVITRVDDYLRSVGVKLADFHLVNQESCVNDTDKPVQYWHLSKYMVLGYHPHFVKPLVVDKNI